ncbi:ABC transporter ATP-binding protein [Corynebacterium endometrii]|uniref:Multidrug export ATP-binding/permease protein n=1 Tax=Corynebacterium endometrii TaxID=2488819 RepID=A0A4V1CEK2_9CORY|nr:ABC transporter ATP-binding protein [Corynebacterium endometrii]QCB28398.1 Putative multidrug export ATP-binding/permease protein [Corynebacterium endometrii]
MRFPTAEWPQVRHVALRHVRQVPKAGRQFILAIILLAAGSVANIYVPIFLGRIVDAVVGEAELSLFRLTIYLVGVAIAGGVLSAVGFYFLSRITERVIANLREDMVGTALGLPTHRVEDAGSGDLVSRSTDDVAELSTAVTETIPVLTTSTFAIITTAAALVTLNWQFVAVAVCALPIYWLAAKMYLKVAPGRYASERAAMANRARRVLEAIHGRETVTAFALEKDMHERINEASEAVRDKAYRARRTMFSLQLWMAAVEFTMLAAGLIVGFYVVRTGDLTVGAVTSAMLMLIRLRGPLMSLMRVLDTIQSGYASLSRIVGVVIDPPKPVPPSGAPEPEGRVVMSNVSFSYGDGWAVEDVSLSIGPGETVALVGASGAGKTTVAALLSGLRVPTSGDVRIDGVEVSQLSDAERVARLAMVSQDVHVFSGTLREDLSLANPTATDEEMLEALERVDARFMDNLIDGLDTVVGARGVQLEPVEAQQLALARILLLDPKVVVMDEATAEAGSVGAGHLEASADEVTKGRAALVVAHRLDQASQADQILVMDNGRIVEQGTHEQLLRLDGRYQKLWAAWQKGRV